jgi:SAM-dependent methyltransferase
VPDLLKLSGDYWSTCTLHAGVRLNLFTPLAERPHSAAQLSDQLKTHLRATAMLLDALAALGLLVKEGDAYETTPFSGRFLSRSSEQYLGFIIMHHHHLVSGWAQLHEAVTSGDPVKAPVSHVHDESMRENFLMGMFNLASLLAPKIVAEVDLSGRRRLLDLGGGPGTYAIHFCGANPGLQATVYDLPTTRAFAEKTIARYGVSDRIAFVAGDYHADPVPAGFDVAWLSHVLHADGPEACADLLNRAVAALEPGGILMVQEFILNDAKDGPLFPALFSLNMLLATDGGQAYSETELCAMLKAAGLTDVQRIVIDLPNGAGIIRGTKR